MKNSQEYLNYEPGSKELVDKLVEDHHGWATSIAKSVARAWNMDWQLDGLDGGAYEALLFCAKRFDPSRGVPFRGYARRRIHEACTEESRQCRQWQSGLGTDSEEEVEAREISLRLFELFPELREGLLPPGADEGDQDSLFRGSVRQLLAGASLVTAFQEGRGDNPEKAVEYRRMVEILAQLEPVHQCIIWAIYYAGQSMRSLAEEWNIDDLSIIREHKNLLEVLFQEVEQSRKKPIKAPKVRRGLKLIAHKLKKEKNEGPFVKFLETTTQALVFFTVLFYTYWNYLI